MFRNIKQFNSVLATVAITLYLQQFREKQKQGRIKRNFVKQVV